MSKAHIPDDILNNILIRLPGKPLLRFKCVSKHWNCLISHPCFVKSRSRLMILLSFPRHADIIDDNVPIDDKAHSMVKIRSRVQYQEGTKFRIVGTLNGIVVVVYTDVLSYSHVYLYNPLTGASKLLFVIDRDSAFNFPYVFGFGYGLTTDDLKIIKFGICDHVKHCCYTCDVFDLTTSSWIGSSKFLKRDFFFLGDVSICLDGFLYWVTVLLYIQVLVLNVKTMKFLKISVPFRHQYMGTILGSLDGSLCIIIKIGTINFDLWVMTGQGVADSWLKAYSFTFGLEGNVFYEYHPMCISGNGNILFTNGSNQLFIYDTSNATYKTFNDLVNLDNFEDIKTLMDFKRIRSIEYMESLVSPSDICFV